MSEQFGEKCNINKNDILGRYVTAKHDLRPGEVLLYEKPIIIVPHWDSDLICVTCFRGSNTICQNCNIFPLCIDCKTHCSFDCNFFSKINEIPRDFLIENFQIFAPIKCLLFIENYANDENNLAKDFLNMESHLMKRKDTQIWKNVNNNIIEPLINSGIGKYLKKSDINGTDIIQKICGILDVNSFEIRGPIPDKSLRGIYIKAALMAHNCISNTMIAIDGKYEMKIYTTVPIKSGEIIYYNYVNVLMGTQERQFCLKIGKYFDCHCKRCDDPTELGTYMSALICQKCQLNKVKGYFLNIKSNWICNNCSKIMEKSEMEKLLANSKDQVLEAQNNIRNLEMLVGKFTTILHPNHYLIVDLKQNIASILRTICNDPMHTPGLAVYQRKLQICEEILSILRIIQPGISRLTGIALYEYFGPFIEILKINKKSTSPEKYLVDLKKAENILRESISMLLYEPINTPEGLLAKNMLLELRDLKEIIKKIDK